MTEETRTKMVCNLGTNEFFTYPHSEGTWRKTDETRTIRGKKYYVCRQREDNSHQLVIMASERVELIQKGDR